MEFSETRMQGILNLFDIDKPETSSNGAGYSGIVERLIKKQICLSTIYAKNLNFSKASKFISFKDSSIGMGLINIFFDIENAAKDSYVEEFIANKAKDFLGGDYGEE